MTFFITRRMKKLTKIFVITVVLLLPVIVFLFLKQFGNNEFALPVYYQDGTPFTECGHDSAPHRLSQEFTKKYLRETPAIIAIEGELNNEFKYDLQNVLNKYPEAKLYKVNLCCISDETRLRILNCELVLGEDRYLDKSILNKYVLVDSARQIRGYFQVNELDEITRLDMELDILLNY